MEFKSVQRVLHDNMMSYGGYIIPNRVMPDIRDGLKPVYRRILYTMHRMSAHNLTKSQNVEGKVMEIHPHGGCYETIVKMVQPDRNMTPMILGKGNFGKNTSTELKAAAQRYTEIKMSNLSKDIFKDINKDMIDFIPNYDGEIMMPEVLPMKFAAILHYAQKGTAVGMATNLPSFNLIELNEATKTYVITGEHTTMTPDFATGGKIVNDYEELKKIQLAGLGKITLRSTVEIDRNVIKVKEVPYGVTCEAIIDSITKLVKNKKIDCISKVDDKTGLDGIEIKITAKKNTDMKLLLENLYKSTPMESSISTNMNIIVDGLPKVLGTNDIIEYWVNWRRGCLIKGAESDIKDMKNKLHKLLGLEKILLDIDKAIEIIRHSKGNEIENSLMNHFAIDEIQAEYVSNIQLRNINEDEIIKKISEIKPFKDAIKDKEDYINNTDRINQTIVNDLDDISKRFGKPRMTEIIDKEKVEESKNKLTKVIKVKQKEKSNEEFKIILTKDGYVKKLKLNSDSGKIKDNDEIIEEFVGNGESVVLAYSGKYAYKVYIEDLSENTSSELGTYIPSLLKLDDISGYAYINDSVKYILTVYDNTKIAKVDATSYNTSTKRTRLDNSVSSIANIIKVKSLTNDIDITLHVKKKNVMYNTSNINPKQSRGTKGVNVKFDSVTI